MLAVARASGSIDIMSSADGAIAATLPPATVASGPHAGTKEGVVIRSMHFLPSIRYGTVLCIVFSPMSCKAQGG